MKPIEGGCCCGNIRYRVSGEPVLSLLCFCADCLSAFGCDGYPGMMVEETNFAVLQGTSTTYARDSKSGRSVTRHFCADCGTNLWGQTELGLVSVAAGTLDDPENFAPTKVTFTEAAPSWARVPDNLEKV